MAGYIRQSSFVDGDTITAAIFNNEYNQLVNAFSNTTGHAHDGTAAEGPVIGLIGDAGETSPNNKVLIDTTNNYIEFYVEVSSAPVQQLYIADGAIVPVTDSDVDLGTSSLYFKDTYTDTVTTTGNVTVGGNLTVTGNATISGNLTFGDADTDSINLAAEIDSDIIPNTDGTYDLGSATKEWQDLYIDGTANIDSLVADTADIDGGTIDGATIATSDITVGASKTLDVSAGTLTLADNQISGDKVEGGTIAATTITDLTFGSLNDGTITVTAFVDEDDMTSDSATLIPTQQSVKAYVDSQVTAQDLDFQGDTGGALSIDLDSETLTIAGGTGLDTVGSGNTVTVAIDSTVATLTDTQTLTNKTLTSPVINTGVSGTGVLDDDTFATATATTLATSESIKAYVDTTVAATNEVVEDTTPQLGGDLDLNSNDITGTGNINNTGTITTDGLTVDGVAKVLGAASNTIVIADATETNGYQLKANASASSDFGFIIEDLAGKDLLKIESNNDISFYEDTGTTAKLFWDASTENLGIGTTGAVTKKLELVSDTSETAQLIVSSDTGTSALYFGSTSDTIKGGIRLDNSDNSLQLTGYNNTERLRIDSSGKVGINVSSPSRRFEVNSGGEQVTSVFSSNSTTAARLSLKDANTTGDSTVNIGAAGDDFVVYAGASQRLRVDSSGNVGIGTASPAEILHVSDTSTAGAVGLRAENSEGHVNFTTNGGGFQFETGASGVVSVIDSSGNVGIGTASPTFKLEVEGTGDLVKFAGANAQLTIDNSTTNEINIDAAGANDKLVFSTVGSERLRIDSSGNVGIGTSSPTELVEISANALHRLLITATDTTMTNGADYGGIGWETNDASQTGLTTWEIFQEAAGTTGEVDLVFDYKGTEAVRLDTSGNVGIGTASPTTQLTASQSANISQVAITSSSNAVAWNATAAANAYYATTENTTFSAPSNAVEGAIISVEIAQGGTPYTVAWNTVFEFAASTAPTVTATANKTDIFSFRYNGSVWQEIGRTQNMAQT